MNPVVKWIYDVMYVGLEKFGRYYSNYRAFVHDNEDPENLHRLQLIIPGIAPNPSDYWAWPKNVYFGKNHGSQCIPQKGEIVWVSFELEDPHRPIWAHGHPGTNDWEKIDKRFKSVKNFWFMTPGGIS